MPLRSPNIGRCLILLVFLTRLWSGRAAPSSNLPHKVRSLKESVNKVVCKTTPSSLVAGIMTNQQVSSAAGSGGDGKGLPDAVLKIWHSHRSSCLVLFISLLLAVIWMVVDANWTLFVYDLLTSTNYRSMRDQTVWVTGASSGLGAELVCRLVSANARHVVLSSRRRASLEAVAESCRDRSPSSSTTFSFVVYDASNVELDYQALANEALNDTPNSSIDVLFLNAGIYHVSPSLETPVSNEMKVLQVNFVSPVKLSKALIQEDGWKERKRGQVVVVSSIMGRGGQSLVASYSAAKHALRGYFHSLATEEPWIRVDVVMPGATATNLWSTNFDVPIESTDSIKMPVERCAHLILKGACGPYWLFYETWISRQPGLLWVYLSAYAPDLFHPFIRLIGHLRVKQYQEDGGGSDPLDVPTLLRQLFT